MQYIICKPVTFAAGVQGNSWYYGTLKAAKGP